MQIFLSLSCRRCRDVFCRINSSFSSPSKVAVVWEVKPSSPLLTSVATVVFYGREVGGNGCFAHVVIVKEVYYHIEG